MRAPFKRTPCPKCATGITPANFTKHVQVCDGHPRLTSIHRPNSFASERYSRSLKGRYSHLKTSAKLKNLGAELSFQQFCTATQSPCNYCHADPTIIYGCGIDRLDNRFGYVPTNVVGACNDCNRKKGWLEAAGFVYPRTIELMKELLNGQVL